MLKRFNKFILFTIADMFWVKQTRQMHVIRGYKNEQKFRSHLFFINPCKNFIHHEVTVHPVKTHCVKGLLEVTPFFTSRVVKIELIHAVRLLIKVICSKNLSITSAAPIVSEPERGTEGFKTASKLHV